MRYYEVDGTVIANHMEKPANGGLVWMAICLGMATDGLEGPLMDAGVGVVYGYSQSVYLLSAITALKRNFSTSCCRAARSRSLSAP